MYVYICVCTYIHEFFQECFGEDWVLVVDESHVTLPQIGGMWGADRARKVNLVNHGFRYSVYIYVCVCIYECVYIYTWILSRKVLYSKLTLVFISHRLPYIFHRLPSALDNRPLTEGEFRDMFLGFRYSKTNVLCSLFHKLPSALDNRPLTEGWVWGTVSILILKTDLIIHFPQATKCVGQQTSYRGRILGRGTADLVRQRNSGGSRAGVGAWNWWPW
jgi:hypothetical protein